MISEFGRRVREQLLAGGAQFAHEIAAALSSPIDDVRTALAERNINAPAACFYAIEASRVLGLGDAGALRIGLAPYNDDADADRLLDALGEVVRG